MAVNTLIEQYGVSYSIGYALANPALKHPDALGTLVTGLDALGVPPSKLLAMNDYADFEQHYGESTAHVSPRGFFFSRGLHIAVSGALARTAVPKEKEGMLMGTAGNIKAMMNGAEDVGAPRRRIERIARAAIVEALKPIDPRANPADADRVNFLQEVIFESNLNNLRTVMSNIGRMLLPV